MAKLAAIEDFLKKRGAFYRVIDLGGEVFTVADVVATGVERNDVVKTLLVRTGGNSKSSPLPESGIGFVALCLHGEDRVDFKKVRKMFGSRSELAKPKEVKKIVGVPIGAVCPILIGVPVYIDKKVLKLKKVNLGSGDLKKGLEMKLKDLLAVLPDFQIADLVLDSVRRSI